MRFPTDDSSRPRRRGGHHEHGLRPDAPWGPGARFSPGGPGGPGGRGHRGGPRGPRGPRRSRGDVRAAVLTLLAEQPMHGYQLMQTITERSHGRWTPSPGAIYPTLAQLEDEGLIALDVADGRKQASLTDAGRAHLSEHAGTWPDPFGAADADDAPDLHTLGRELGEAVRHTARTGTPGQRANAAEILIEARRALYRTLADGTQEDA